jgi:hypothetical protein
VVTELIMQQELPQHHLWPLTAIAVRNSSGPGWRLVELDCELQDLSRRVAESQLDEQEYRLVGNGHAAPEYRERFLIDHARRGGWHQDRETGAWFPIEEPLSELLGTPVYVDVSLSLKSIMYGWITIVVGAGGKELTLWIDDIEDSLVLLVRFTQVLAADGAPHAALADRATAHFVVQDGPATHLCRFHIESYDEAAGRTETIDVLTDRRELVRHFRNLAAAIADHPFFSHHFVCHCCLPDAEYDRVSDVAELEWAIGVHAGRFPDDFDVQEQFVAARIASEVTLPDGCAEVAREEQAMLRSLESPGDWLRRYGLVSWTTGSPVPMQSDTQSGNADESRCPGSGDWHD